jgi:hypothetical protein
MVILAARNGQGTPPVTFAPPAFLGSCLPGRPSGQASETGASALLEITGWRPRRPAGRPGRSPWPWAPKSWSGTSQLRAAMMGQARRYSPRMTVASRVVHTRAGR